MRPTRQGWALLAASAGLIALGRLLGLLELFGIGAALVVLVAVCAAYVGAHRAEVTVDRFVRPPRVHAGNPSTVELRVRNSGSHPSPVLRLRDPVTGTAGADLLLAPLSAKAAADVAYRLPSDHRGLVRIGPLAVEVTDPFGLVTARTRPAPEMELTILPRVEDLLPMPRAVGPDPDGVADRAGSLGRAGEDFAALRPYVVGDDMRRVHWGASARTDDDLLVRQDEVPWQGRICAVLDVRRPAHDADTVERAVTVTASVLRAHLRRGDHVRLVSTDGTDSGDGIGLAHLEAILEYLAVAQRSNHGTLRGVLDVVDRGASGALLVVTGRPAETDLEAVERMGPTFSMRRVVRLDVSGRAKVGRNTEILGIAPGAPIAAAWNAASPPAGRARRPRRVARS